MANNFDQADVNDILNQPGVFNFRAFGSVGVYTKAVFTNGASFAYTPTVNTQEFDDTGDVYDYIGDEAGEIAFAYGKVLDIDFMSKLGNGLFKLANITSGAQAVVAQVISGGWVNKETNTLKLVDSDGIFYKADGEPAITSVSGSAVGILAAGDDYFIVPYANSKSGYGIMLNTAGTAGVATTEDVTIVFNDPTVVSQTQMSGGGAAEYSAIEGFYDTKLRDGRPAQVYFHRGFYNGNLNIGFSPENDKAAATTDVTISLKNDPSRAEKERMFTIVIGA